MTRSEKLRVTSIRQTCDACPSQWEGTLEDGREIYVRYRWGILHIGVGGRGREWLLETLSHDLDGVLTFEELVNATQGKIEWLAAPEDEDEHDQD
jgi:hypothetical protein